MMQATNPTMVALFWTAALVFLAAIGLGLMAHHRINVLSRTLRKRLPRRRRRLDHPKNNITSDALDVIVKGIATQFDADQRHLAVRKLLDTLPEALQLELLADLWMESDPTLIETKKD